MSEQRQEFEQSITSMFASLGNAIAEMNRDGEWVSATVNITANPKGEGPVISSVIYAGTTKSHALKVQKALAAMFVGLNKK